MSTQLRIVEIPETIEQVEAAETAGTQTRGRRAAASRDAAPPRQRAGRQSNRGARPAARGRVAPSRRRTAKWKSDWHLDTQARQVGREGVAAARVALARAADAELPHAS